MVSPSGGNVAPASWFILVVTSWENAPTSGNVELATGLAILLITPVKLGTLASELTIVSRLTEFASASGTADAVGAELATALAVPSKLGMLVAML